MIDTESPSNMIASADGQIEALRVTGGFTTVKLGQTVKKGDLLVSGIIDSAALGYRLVRARGEVLARTTKTYQVEIPFETTEKIYSGRFFSQKTVKFFSKSIKLFRKDSICFSSCDKIESERRIYLFGLIKLPIFITETEYAEYEIVQKTLSQKEALAEAYRQLRALYENDLAEAEILVSGIEYATLMTTDNGVSLQTRIAGALHNILGIYGIDEAQRNILVQKVFSLDYQNLCKRILADFKKYVSKTNKETFRKLIHQ